MIYLLQIKFAQRIHGAGCVIADRLFCMTRLFADTRLSEKHKSWPSEKVPVGLCNHAHRYIRRVTVLTVLSKISITS